MAADLLAHLSESIITPAQIAVGPVFISYSRANRAFALDLREKLERMGFKIWRDIEDMPIGDKWWTAIQEAIQACETLVLCMSPESLASTNVADEWHYARELGKRVMPVVVEAVDFKTVPRWMGRFDWADFRLDSKDADRVWARLVTQLNMPYELHKVPFMVEALPPDFVARPNEFEPLINALVNATHGAVAISAALKGAGGFGKTTLARAVCHDNRVRGAFDDGILWVTLGEKIGEQDLISQLLDLCFKLTGSRPPVTGITAASDEFRKAIGDSYILLVIDDVWQSAHVQPFLNPGKNAATLITTRNSGVLPVNTLRQDVDAMRSDEALTLLRFGLPADSSAALSNLTKRLGEWPLLIKLANGALRKRIAGGENLSGAITWIGKALDRKGFSTLDNLDDPTQRDHAVSATLSVSLELLDHDQRAKYERLAIFPEDADVPLATLEKLWAVDDFDVEEVCQRCGDLSLLLKYDLKTRTIQLHDVVRTYLTDTHRIDLPARNRAFLDSYRKTAWHMLPPDEPYLWRNIAYHLIAADQADRLRALLLDYRFLRAKLEATDAGALAADCDSLLKLGKDETIRLLRSAIMLSEATLSEDKDALGHQLVGRLMLHRAKNEEIRLLTDSIPDLQPGLYPIDFDSSYPTHMQAAGALLRTLTGHTGNVNGALQLADGRLLSWSKDCTLRLWTADGVPLNALIGHTRSVREVLVIADGRFLSWSSDATLRLWATNGAPLNELIGHTNNGVFGALVLADGRFLSWGPDGTLRLWGADGTPLTELSGHTDSVNGALVLADGRFLSWSDEKTLRLWGADGTPLTELTGHTDRVNGALVLADGRFLSWSMDKTLRLWTADGVPLTELSGHTDWVFGALELADGRFLSWGKDKTLRLWAADGTSLHELIGHTDPVRGALALADGNIVSLGTESPVLRLWTIDSVLLTELTGHTDRVNGALELADGRFLSWSDDKTLRLWASDGTLLTELTGHTDRVNGALVLADGRFLSWSMDKTLRLWAADGTPLIKMRGHTSGIGNALALANGRFLSWVTEYDPNGTMDLEGSDLDLTLRMWTADGRALAILRLRHWATRILELADGRILSLSMDMMLQLWAADGTALDETEFDGSYERLGVWETKHNLSLAEIFQDKPTVERESLKVQTDHNQLTLYRIADGALIARYYGDADFRTAKVAADDHTIVTGDGAGRMLFLRYRE